MNPNSKPNMKDPADKELHRRQGVDPHPVPNTSELAGNAQGDLEDPGTVDCDAPHDRGKARDGGYTTGVDAMKKKLKNEGEMDDWKKGRTQDAPPKP